uniref:Uncharacterized protein n=1 Tax=Glossina pallidipes TaxID=7398 RepID=A0A1A9ZIS1_GLOPL
MTYRAFELTTHGWFDFMYTHMCFQIALSSERSSTYFTSKGTFAGMDLDPSELVEFLPSPKVSVLVPPHGSFRADFSTNVILRDKGTNGPIVPIIGDESSVGGGGGGGGGGPTPGGTSKSLVNDEELPDELLALVVSRPLFGGIDVKPSLLELNGIFTFLDTLFSKSPQNQYSGSHGVELFSFSRCLSFYNSFTEVCLYKSQSSDIPKNGKSPQPIKYGNSGKQFASYFLGTQMTLHKPTFLLCCNRILNASYPKIQSLHIKANLEFCTSKELKFNIGELSLIFLRQDFLISLVIKNKMTKGSEVPLSRSSCTPQEGKADVNQ